MISRRSVDYRRLLLAFIAIICLLVGVFLALANQGDNNSLSGILIRVGLMVGATWLAFPVIQTPDGKHSLLVIAVLLGLVLLVAARPRLFVVGLASLIFVVGLNWTLKKLSSSL